MKRRIAAFLIIAILMGMIPFQAFATENTEPVTQPQEETKETPATKASVSSVWNGMVAGGFARGEGTADRPYIIETAEQLAYLAQSANNGESYFGLYIELVADLDLNDREWTPIADGWITENGSNVARKFQGTFDGNGHTIYGLRQTKIDTAIVESYHGLFGNNAGTIQNLNVVDADLSFSVSGQYSWAGILARGNEGSIINCHTSGTISGSSYNSAGGLCNMNDGEITRSSANVTISLNRSGDILTCVGGLVSSNSGTITYCKAAGSVSASASNYAWAGGLVCDNDSVISDSYATASVGATSTAEYSQSYAGGLVGDLGGSVKNCYATGSVSCQSANSCYAGGLVGYAQYGKSVENSYAGNSTVSGLLSQVTGYDANVGKLLGYNSRTTVSSSYVNQNMTISRSRYVPEESGGCGSSTAAYNDTSNEANCFGETGSYTTNPRSLVGWGTYATGALPLRPWVDNGTHPILYTEKCVEGRVYYSLNGEVFDADYTILYPGETVTFVAPQMTGYFPSQDVVDLTLTKDTTIYVTYDQVKHNVRFICTDMDGTWEEIITAAEPVAEGDSYTIKVPEIDGYTPEVETVSGVMGAQPATHTVRYTPNTYSVTIHYVYEETGETAAASYYAQRVYGNSLTVTAPSIAAYKPMLSDSTESWDAPSITIPPNYAGDYVQTVEYARTDEVLYKLVVHVGGQPLPGVEVTFNGSTKVTAPDGSVVYILPPGTEKVSLRLYKEGYHGGIYQETREYALKTSMCVDYLEMKLDTARPEYSVQGITCYGQDIANGYGVINTHFDEEMLIYVKGNVPEGAKIEKMLLVQDVVDRMLNDDRETLESNSEVYIRKVLQTVEAGDENLTADGYCSFWRKGTQFDHNNAYDTPIYVYMYVENGQEPIVQKLQIDTIKMEFEANFEKLFDNMELTLQGTGVEFLDGVELSLEFSDDDKLNIPITMEMQNNEIFIGYDMSDEFGDALEEMAQKNNSTTPRQFEKNAKKFLDDAAQELNRKYDTGSWRDRKYSSDFTLEAKFAGGICLTMHGDGHITCQAMVKLGIAAEASWTMDFVVIVVPVTVTVSVGAEGVLTISHFGYDFQKQEILWPELEAEVKAKLGLSAGIGNRIASIGVFCDISAGIKLTLGEKCRFDMLVLNGKGGFYAKLDVGLFELRGEKAWTFLDQTIYLAQSDKIIPRKNIDSGQTGTYLGHYDGLPVYEMSEYKLESMLVKQKPSAWTVSGANVYNDDVLMQADARMVEYEGTEFVFYYIQQPDRETINAKTLVYQVDGGDPIPVDDNGTGDVDYDVIVAEGKLYIVCTQASAPLSMLDENQEYKTDDVLLKEIALAQELYIYRYDTASQSFLLDTQLTNDTCYDTMPSFGVANGTTFLIWNKNTADDDTAVFCANRKNDIYYTVLAGGTWYPAQCIQERCYPVVDMTLFRMEEKPQVAVILDEDENLYTEDDRNIYLIDLNGNVTFVDCYGSTISNLQAEASQNGLVWLAGDQLMGLESSQEGPFAYSGKLTVSGSFKQFSMSEYGVTALMWVDATTEGNYLKVAYKNADGRMWSAGATVANIPYLVSSWDARQKGNYFYWTFANTCIETPETSGEASLESRTQVFYDYGIVPGRAIATDYTAKFTEDGTKVELNVTISNCSPQIMDTVTINLIDKVRNETQGTVVNPGIKNAAQKSADPVLTYETVETTYSVEDVSLNLKPGISWKYTIYIDRVEGMVLEDYAVTVTDIVYGEEDGSSGSVGGGTILAGPPSTGNTTSQVETVTAYPALSVMGEYVIIGPEGYLSLRVDNIGDATANGTLHIYRLTEDGTTDGEPLYTEAITELMKANAKYCLIRLDDSYFTEGKTTELFQCIVECENDRDLTDNTATIAGRKVEAGEETVRDVLVQAPELSTYQQTFDKYAPEDLSLEITVNEDIRSYLGCLDENLDNVDHTVADTDTGKHITFSQNSLQQLAVGSYEYRFFFKTDAGYIDALYTLQVIDNTPIPLEGQLQIAENTKAGLVELDKVYRGMVLEAVTDELNTQSVTYEWLVGGSVVATDKQFTVAQIYLGQELQLRVTGIAPYFGSVTTEVMPIEKVARRLEAPVIIPGEDRTQVTIRKEFSIGGTSLLYGYSKANDPSTVTNWSSSNTFTLPDMDLYYFFTMSNGNSTYEEAVSEGVAYTAQVAPPAIALKSMNIQLGSSMSLNLNGLASVLDQYEDVYVIFQADGQDPVKVTEYFESINQSDNTLRYNFAFEGLTILDLNLNVNYTIYGTFNGKLYQSETKSITLLKYCRSSVLSGNDAAVPCANLIKYAMAAEAYIKEIKPETDESKFLVNVLTETELAAVETYAYADSAFNARKTSVVQQGTRVKFKAQALDMVSRITLLYKIEITDSTVDTSTLTFKVEYTDTEGTAQVKNYTFSDLTYDEATGYYVLSFSEFYATQMREGAKCTIYIDGVEHAAYTNSIENYCYTANISATESDAVKYLAKRISLYGDACYATYGNQ